MTNYPSTELMQKIYSLLINTSFSLRITPPAESTDLEISAKIVEYAALLFNDVSKNICRDKACKDFIEKTEKYLREKYKTNSEKNICE